MSDRTPGKDTPGVARDYDGKITAQVIRGYRLAGAVTTVQTLRCECNAWMRPGIDHTCRAEDRPDHGAPAW